MTDKAAILESLTETASTTPGTDAPDLIEGVRDYIEGTQDTIAGTALAEVAYAFVAGYEHATGHDHGGEGCPTRAAYDALRKAGLTL